MYLWQLYILTTEQKSHKLFHFWPHNLTYFFVLYTFHFNLSIHIGVLYVTLTSLVLTLTRPKLEFFREEEEGACVVRLVSSYFHAGVRRASLCEGHSTFRRKSIVLPKYFKKKLICAYKVTLGMNVWPDFKLQGENSVKIFANYCNFLVKFWSTVIAATETQR